jgi:type I restriction enzyme S subunit
MTTLASAGKWGSGGTPRRGTPGYYGGNIPWLKIGDLDDGTVTGSEERITARALKESSAKLVPPGTLLVAMYGSIGKLGITGAEVATNQAIAHCVVNHERFETDFVFYYLLSQRANLLEEGKGGTQANISQTVLKAYPLPEPTPPEQRRIVARLKGALDEIRRAQACLERVPLQVKRLKQSILASAFRGDLTAEWREQNAQRFQHEDTGGDPEWLTGDLLLARILKERPQRWDADKPAKTAAETLAPQNVKGKARHAAAVEPETGDLEDLEEVPGTWNLVSADQLLIQPVTNGLSIPGSEKPPGLRALKLGALRGGDLDLSVVRYLPLKATDMEHIHVRAGDFFIARGNGSLPLVGRGALAKEPASPTIFPDTMIRCRFAESVRSYVTRIWDCPQVRSQLEQRAKTSAGIWKLSQPDVKRTTLYLPPIAEQHEIVATAEALFAEVDKIARVATTTLIGLNNLEQSILQSAFRGEL